jgi:DtxR family Mn-dependent transcriptional regulator
MSASLEEYLKAIYILIQKCSFARVTDIAKYLNYTKSSVNRALKILKAELLVKYENYGDIELTEEGTVIAKNIIKRHNTLKAFLTDVLDVDKNIAENEAKTMRHSVSENTINKLELYIQSIIDVGDLECDYNPENEKCKNCVKVTAKNRLNSKSK